MLLIAILYTNSVLARTPSDSAKSTRSSVALEEWPAWCSARHDIGKISLAVANDGTIGLPVSSEDTYYCYPGTRSTGSSNPYGAHSIYNLRGTFWIGAIVNGDTLVSTGFDAGHWFAGREFNPDIEPYGFIQHRSIIDPEAPEFKGAISEQDLITTYYDTLVGEWMYNETDHRTHKPIGLEIDQRSYAWSYSYAEDFILFDYTIKNVSDKRLTGVYLGLWVEGSVTWTYVTPEEYNWEGYDDITGFLYDHETEYGGCQFHDTVNLAWFADNDAAYQDVGDSIEPLTGIGGVRLVRTPSETLKLSYNWWTPNYDPKYDYGPQTFRTYRDLGTGATGMPVGDKNKYHYLSNGEFDFDQVCTSTILPDDGTWVFPNQSIARDISDGYDAQYLLSFGPFSISPGQQLPVSFAYIRGDDFHRDPNNAPKYLTGDIYRPTYFMRNVHFDDIVKNAMWASWVYDNPGVDTDGDGYYGKFRLCCVDSSITSIDSTDYPPDTVWSYDNCREVYYEGDGVPDFRGASPPPSPKVWLEPSFGQIRVRWNGMYSENTPDIFTRTIDFEGYRVHMSLDSRESSYTLLASYDRENFDKLVWNPDWREWEIIDTPFTQSGLACLYGNSCDERFNPLEFTRGNPYLMPGFPDSIFYFAPHEYDRSVFGATSPIKKVYPDEPYPSTLILEDAPASELTEDGYLKYFEYEYTIKDILPTVQYYVSVTTFDYGAPKSGLDALETSKTLNAQRVYAMPSVDEVTSEGLPVYVYPNPYRIDGGYREDGFEGREAVWYIPERDRRIHFANLPAKCTIGIYSLDGDMIREIEHDRDPNAADASHDTWDMITRNTQAITTGIYYWTVTDDHGKTQIGKFVVIK